MTLRRLRILMVLFGLALPYLARLPGGMDWLKQYTDVSVVGWLFLTAFNAIAVMALLGVSAAYRHRASLLAPAVAGFGFLAWAHGSLDLAADAQAAIALVFIPLLALLPIFLGGWIGSAIDKALTSRAP